MAPGSTSLAISGLLIAVCGAEASAEVVGLEGGLIKRNHTRSYKHVYLIEAG